MENWFFIANNTIGDSGLSGGDRIYIELARNWKDKVQLSIIGTEETITVCKREGLTDVDFLKTSTKLGLKNVFTMFALFSNFFKKLFNGVLFIIKNTKLFKNSNCVYSVSDFYPDSIPAFLIKLINKKVIWIAGFYLFAPAPFQKDSPYKGKDFLRGFLYWLSQIPIHWIVNRYADIVFITSEPDKKRFIRKKRDESKIIVIRGGVNISDSTKYLNSQNVIPVEKRKYDACFVGRFHQQKGVLVLIDIWKEVVKLKPDAKLAMIGNGPLEEEVKNRAKEYGIGNNIDLFGFLDGEKKYAIFQQSKIVVHPATYDSGGMASAEAMAWELPGISFDLEALKTYYPKGMIKIPQGNNKNFAEEIIKLLFNKEYYANLSKQARDLIIEKWSWDKRATEIFRQI
ncbi:MAG: glycosyltransferase family 4 protein [Candidatus Firestonebacteria bacterium]